MGSGGHQARKCDLYLERGGRRELNAQEAWVVEVTSGYFAMVATHENIYNGVTVCHSAGFLDVI